MKYLFIAFVMASVAFGQNPKMNREKDNLKGNVKSVKSTSFRIEKQNGKNQKVGQLSGFNTLEVFDNQGYKLHGIRLSNEGKSQESWAYTYDSKKNLLEVTIYDPNKQIREVLKYSYNPQTLTGEVMGYDANGKFSGKQVATYDKKGNKISEISLDEKENFLLKMESTYDAKSNLLEKSFEDKESKKVRLKYVYDKHNNVVEENYYGEGNQLYGQKIFSYKYDSKGNWIERTEQIYGVENVLTQREIIYFK